MNASRILHVSVVPNTLTLDVLESFDFLCVNSYALLNHIIRQYLDL